MHLPRLNFQGCTPLARKFYSLEVWYLDLHKTVLYRVFLKSCEFIYFHSFFPGIQVVCDMTQGRFDSGCRRCEGTYLFSSKGQEVHEEEHKKT